MDKKKTQKDYCKNVFKNSSETVDKNQFTQKWIELINRLEKSKTVGKI